jgi:hypothetical protein
MEPVAAPLIEGWKSIADALERTERSCRRYAKRRRDPLPVYRYLGTVVIHRTALEDWKRRQGTSYNMDPV